MSKTRGFSDVGLLDCLRQARPPDEAVRFIYKTYFRMCSSVVIKGSGNHQDAEDIFQEAVVSFIEMVRSGRFRGSRPSAAFCFL
ncbi:hypothetical protein ACQ86N_12370 [Puia sp. P3]|uniref:hypothetical protein n=1 Tax=Puia sp. P3 TaxID=3423952 RepID=UPI003D668EA4